MWRSKFITYLMIQLCYLIFQFPNILVRIRLVKLSLKLSFFFLFCENIKGKTKEFSQRVLKYLKIQDSITAYPFKWLNSEQTCSQTIYEKQFIVYFTEYFQIMLNGTVYNKYNLQKVPLRDSYKSIVNWV